MPAASSAAAIPQNHVQLDLLVERHQPALDKIADRMLGGVTATEAVPLTKPFLRELLAAAFAAGLVDACRHNQFARPSGTIAQSQN